MENKLKILGIISLVLGSMAALFCVIPLGFLYAVLLGFLGTIFSTIYVFIDTRYVINKKRITHGIIGMILSSIPILLILAVIIAKQFK